MKRLLIVTLLTGLVSIGVAVIFHEGIILMVANAPMLSGYKEKRIAA